MVARFFNKSTFYYSKSIFFIICPLTNKYRIKFVLWFSLFLSVTLCLAIQHSLYLSRYNPWRIITSTITARSDNDSMNLVRRTCNKMFLQVTSGAWTIVVKTEVLVFETNGGQQNRFRVFGMRGKSSII